MPVPGEVTRGAARTTTGVTVSVADAPQDTVPSGMGARPLDTTIAALRAITPAPNSGRRAIDRQHGAPEANAQGSPRKTLDVILQSAAVDLFHNSGFAVAPLASCPVERLQRYHEHVAMLGFDGPQLMGVLTLSIPEALLPPGSASILDWMGELSNQLFGRVMNRLAVFQLKLRPRVPIGLSGPILERLRKRTPSEVLYRFRTVRGDILVTLDAPLDDVTLAYSGTAQVAHEGDVILF